MKIKDMSIDELELLPYDELALLILKESGEKYTTIDLFREIGKILNMSNEEIEKKVTDFFTTLSTNKNFLLLNDGKWDLKSNHAIKVSLNNLEEEEEDIEDLEEGEELEDDGNLEDIDNISLVEDEEEIDDDSDLDDLVIIDEEELEE